MKLHYSTLLIVLGLLLAACSANPGESAAGAAATTTSSPSSIPATTAEATSTNTTAPLTTSTTTTISREGAEPVAVRTGAQVLADSGFGQLTGARVGLIAHQNSLVEVDGLTQHLGDALFEAADVELVALFGPEHGVRGTADAGELVADTVDERTDVPIFSLFGSTRKPTPEMLQNVDVLVYDLQDVGTRYYTYISTMGLAMQAAGEQGIPFVVLDRPNPLGGSIAGGVLEPSRVSFVGQYPIPDQYGLTAGELALEIIEQQWLSGLDDLDLNVVSLDGWTRDMRWADTGLDWIAPSPALNTPESALLYPATIWFEATAMSYGRGTTEPFRVLGAPWLNTTSAIEALAARELPGIRFHATNIAPELLPGITVTPAFVDQTIPALRLEVTDPAALRPTELGVHLLDVMSTQAETAGVEFLARPAWLDQLSGNTLLRTAVESGQFDVDATIDARRQQSELATPTIEDGLLYE